jgi:hypothetical protein
MASYGVLLINAIEMKKGLSLAQILSKRYGRTELSRGGKRIIRQFKKRYLSGPPGIKGGQFKRGKHAFSFPTFRTGVDDVTVGLSRILRVHEEGAEIKAKSQAKGLFISKKTGVSGAGQVLAVAKSVKIPKRTKFVMLTRAMSKDIAERVAQANARGVTHAMEQTMNRIAGA